MNMFTEIQPVGEPTIDDLQRAWTHAMYAEEIGGARASSLIELLLVRNKRTTWLGEEQLSLRAAIDNYLSAH